MAEQLNNALTILRRKEVERRTGLSRSSIYAKISEGTFPPQIRLGLRAVGWNSLSVETWIADRIAQSRKAAP